MIAYTETKISKQPRSTEITTVMSTTSVVRSADPENDMAGTYPKVNSSFGARRHHGTRARSWPRMRWTCSPTSRNTCDTHETNEGKEAASTHTRTGNSDAKAQRQLPQYPPVGVAHGESPIDGLVWDVGRPWFSGTKSTSKPIMPLTARRQRQPHRPYENASKDTSYVENGPAVRRSDPRACHNMWDLHGTGNLQQEK
jgi:hypothetical protein